MNRSERRRNQKELNKAVKTVKSLTPEQSKIINELANIKARVIMDNYAEAISRTFTAVLIDKGYSLEEIEEMEDEYVNYIFDDMEKVSKLKSELNEEELSMAINKMSEQVKAAVIEILERGLGKKEALEELKYKFPKASKAMLTNVYQKIKEDREIDEKVEAIFSDEPDDKKEDPQNKKVQEKKQTEKKVEKKTKVKKEKENKTEDSERGMTPQEAAAKFQPVLKPLRMKGNNFTYDFAESGVKIAEGLTDKITRECIIEQAEALNVWKRYYSK